MLHGLTMSGSSMRRYLGSLGTALEDAGLRLLTPDAPHTLAPEALEHLGRWMTPAFAALGDDPRAWFAEGVFWDGVSGHHDWFDAHTDPDTGRRSYRALAASLALVEEACRGHRVVGVLGFSQGAAMAALVAGLASRGTLDLGSPVRFAILLSGFLPRFDDPALDPWPARDVAALVRSGSRDPLFPDPAGQERLAAAFPGADLRVIPGLRHELPQAPEDRAELVAFARAHGLG